VYNTAAVAAATVGPKASSGSGPRPGPITIRETPIDAMIANYRACSISRALDRTAGSMG